MEGVRWAQRMGMWRLQGAFLGANAASCLIDLGRWDEAWQLLDGERDPATEGVGRLNQAITVSQLALATGRVDHARQVLRSNYEVIQRLRDSQFTGPMYVGLAEIARRDGRFDEVRRYVAEGLDRMSETEDPRRRPELITVGLRAAAEQAGDARAHRRPSDEIEAREQAGAWLATLRELMAATAKRGAEIETLARIARIDLAAGVVPDDAGAATSERPFGLTERELEVLQQLVGGLSNRQIGETLFISESTAGVHVSNILGKLGVTSRVEAAAIAVRSGIAE